MAEFFDVHVPAERHLAVQAAVLHSRSSGRMRMQPSYRSRVVGSTSSISRYRSSSWFTVALVRGV